MASGEFFKQSLHSAQIDDGAASFSFSIPSQPPDIRNWFPSYEYESSNSSDALHEFEDEIKEPYPKEENRSLSEEISQSEYSLKSNCLTTEARTSLLFDKEPQSKISSEDETVSTDAICPNEFHPAQKKENFPRIIKENYETSDNISNQNGILKCEEAFLKHEEQKENGFISTGNRDAQLKHRINSKNQSLSVNGKRGRIEQQEDIAALGKKQCFSVKGVLTDQTNVRFAEEAIAAEAPGKWQCPRKSKPYAGPPLKQLQLESWVRRVA